MASKTGLNLDFVEESFLSGLKAKHRGDSGFLWNLFQIFILVFIIGLLLVLGAHCLKRHVFGKEVGADGTELLASSLQNHGTNSDKEAFMKFIDEFKRDNLAKNATELLRRFRNFVENLREMEKLQNESPNVVFKVNNFFDLSEDELRLRLIPFQDFERDNLRFKPNSEDSEMPRLKTVGDRPPFFDWRTKQKVTRIKDQGQCGSCYAFSATAVAESQIAIRSNELVELSEQQLIDCDTSNRGCSGGSRPSSFGFIQDNGLTLEKLYFYVGKKQNCRNITAHIHKIDTYRWLNNDEDKLADWLVNHGPFSIGMNVTKGMYYYSSGVFSPSPEECAQKSLGSHAMAVVGYGELNGEPYWILKNSWSESHGESGYLKLRRGVNACGFANAVLTAAVNH